jgi:hypothetical protein
MKRIACVLGRMLFIGSLLALTGCHRLATDTPTPPAPPLVVADFDRCQSTNNLGGAMGPAYNPPDRLTESYIAEAGRGCVARLAFDIVGWSAFWLKLQGADLRPYQALRFDVRADPQPGNPDQIKVELKRSQGTEIGIAYIDGMAADWSTVRVDLTDLRPADAHSPLATWAGMEDLVFVFEAAKSGSERRVYLDNIIFEH